MELHYYRTSSISGIMFVAITLFLIAPVSVFATSTPVKFNPIVNLSSNAGISKTPVVAAVGKNVYVAWVDSSPGRPETFFRASTDNGSTWGKIIQFPLTGSALDVQIAAEQNLVFLTWQQTISGNPAIDFVASADNGSSFGSVQNLSGVTGSTAIGPIVKAYANNVYVTWVRNPQDGVYFDKSVNFGLSFAPPKLVDPNGHEEDMALAGTSQVYLTWDSIYFMNSSDNGTTFSTAVKINTACCPNAKSREPMLSASGKNVYITWTSNSNGPYEAYVAVSQNLGANFTVTNLSGNFLGARELQISSSNSSEVYVNYRGKNTTRTVDEYINVSHDNGTTFTKPIELAKQSGPMVGFGGVHANGTSVYAFWPHGAAGNIEQMFLQASQDAGSTFGGVQQASSSTKGIVGMNDPGDAGPMIGVSGPHVYVVWQDSSTGNGDIYFRSS